MWNNLKKKKKLWHIYSKYFHWKSKQRTKGIYCFDTCVGIFQVRPCGVFIFHGVINFLVGHIWISMSHPGSSRVLSRQLCVSVCVRKMESSGLSGRRYLSGWRLLALYLNPCDGREPLWKSDGITFSSFRSHFFGWCVDRQPHVLCEWWAREGRDAMMMRLKKRGGNKGSWMNMTLALNFNTHSSYF